VPHLRGTIEGSSLARVSFLKVKTMDLIDKSPLLAGLNYSKGQMLFRLGLARHHSGSTGYSVSVEEMVGYVTRVVEDYLHYGSVQDGYLANKHILEIGPGDNLGVGLMFLAHGAESVTCLDGFAPRSNESKNRQVYAALHRSMTREQQSRVEDALREDSDGGMALCGKRLVAHYQAPLEGMHAALAPDTYDIVISRAVLEHLADVREGWANMVRSLKAGGEMWHKVDFRSHKMFDRIHPLYFLTIKENLWRLISRPDPTLNRDRLPLYRDLSAATFESSQIYLTGVLNEAEILPHTEEMILGAHYTEANLETVREIRPHLIERFQGFTDLELMINGIFIISRGRRP
jgi:SAM-dependent methyltransferase